MRNNRWILKSILHYCLLFLLCALISCTDKKAEKESMGLKMDSILVDNQQLNFFINALSASMDSIAQQEGYILETSTQDGVKKPERVQVLENLAFFKDLLNRQREHIAIMQDSLKVISSVSSEKIDRILCFYKEQLDEKDRMIAQLQEELSNKNADITKLNQYVSALTRNVTNLSERNKEQEEALIAQDQIINECYVVIGTKKDLQDAGILSSSNLFKKKQLKVSNFNPEVFHKVDIRTFTEQMIEGKNPKILTQMPENSYTFDKLEKDTYILKIIDPTLFWSVSNYLVIQYN